MDILNNLCRSCNMEKQRLINIHNIQTCLKVPSTKDMLEYCIQTTITSESKYPDFICYDCVKQLEISYRFIKRFRLSQTEFDETHSRLHKIIEINNGCINNAVVVGAIDDECVTQSMNTFEDLENQTENVIENTGIFSNQLNTQINSNIIGSANSSSAAAFDNLPAIICSFCNKTFFTKKALNLHLKLSHKQKISNT